MCGRFVLTADPTVIQHKFDLDSIPEPYTARYNIAPSQPLAVISNDNPAALTFYRWGLVPFWADDPKIGNRMINARSETAHEKPSFRAAFKRRRCLIPADGFFEWTKSNGGKVPMLVHLKDRELFAFAGLWEIWQSSEGDELRTCTILTYQPNDLIKRLHNRMPVILHEEDYETWLSPDELPADMLIPLMRPYESESMDYYEVSTLVNNPSNDEPAVIEPMTG